MPKAAMNLREIGRLRSHCMAEPFLVLKLLEGFIGEI
jgi:hypothetical protein